jgi:molecular chaperone GrpE
MSSEDRPKGFSVSDRRFWASQEEAPAEDNTVSPASPPEAENPVENREIGALRAALAEREQKLVDHVATFEARLTEQIELAKSRLERDSTRERDRMRGQLALPLLEVLDNLDRSLSAAQGPGNAQALLSGVKLVRDQLAGTLGTLGLVAFDALGQPFDPQAHEAIGVMQVGEPELDGKVVAVVKPGYRLGDRLLRPALVQVGKLAEGA